MMDSPAKRPVTGPQLALLRRGLGARGRVERWTELSGDLIGTDFALFTRVEGMALSEVGNGYRKFIDGECRSSSMATRPLQRPRSS
ncbi:hypothetical protein [Micromonospora sp. NPDC049679]|uniref:hypothetical protein n=1 Tax=Micromonospora sp. NPDC049679 TaxID=3155920 RepID=UPI0033EAD93C